MLHKIAINGSYTPCSKYLWTYVLQQEHLKAIKHMIIQIAQQGLTCIMSKFLF